MHNKSEKTIEVRPFLKWAGGKTQLLKLISASLPDDISTYDTYIEPFTGGGAVLFHVLNNFPHIKHIVINDINTDLCNVYSCLKHTPIELISELTQIQKEFYSFNTNEERKQFYLQKRSVFNERKSSRNGSAALLIFLNKTCYNGLYRVNSKNQFNVPFGRFASLPVICNESFLLNCSKLLQKATILNGDYTQTESYISGKTFIYFDPPYKPISKTSSFNAYSFESFGDAEQHRLLKYCQNAHNMGVKWLLSNSDPKNTDAENNFFDVLYCEFNIQRVPAKRYINSVKSKRGVINELLIKNY